jgi:hypothetical protein
VPDVEDTIEADIKAAFAAEAGGSETVETPEPEVVAEAVQEVPEGPARDESGRFASKDKDEGEKPLANQEEPVQTPAQPEVQPQEPGEPAIQPPHSLKAAVKANWSTLAPDVQQELVRLDKTVQDAKTEWSGKGERLNRFESLFSPEDRDRLTLAGTDEFRFIQGLKKADEMLQGPNKRDAWLQIGAMYGISPPEGPAPAQTAAEAAQYDPGRPQLDPAQIEALLQPYVQRLAGVEQTITQQATAEEQAAKRAAEDRVTQFQNETNADGSLKHLYFENVKALMKTLLESEAATDLEDAYEMAIHAHPEVRKLIVPASPAQQPKTPQAPTRPAGLSVTGPPTHGPKPNGSASSSNNIEDDIREALREHAGAV